MLDGYHLCRNWGVCPYFPEARAALLNLPDQAQQRNGERFVSTTSRRAVSEQSAGCLRGLQSKAAGSPWGPPSPLPTSASLSWHLCLTWHKVWEQPGEWRLAQGGGGLWGNKVQRRKAYPFTPCWSRLPCFLRTGSQPRDYVTSGGHGRWCAGLDTSNPALTLTFTDMAPQPLLLWGVEQRGMASDPISCHLAQQPWPARP